MRAVFVGGNALTVECAQLWLARGNRITGLASGSGTVRRWAGERGIPEARTVSQLEPVRSGRPFDYLFSVVQQSLLPSGALGLPRVLPINFHDALLPADAGMHASAWALARGSARHGITWHVMTARADAGDILVRREFPIGPRDTSETVNLRCYEAGLDAFGELVERIASGTLTRTVQDLNRRTYHAAGDRPAAALTLDPGQPAERLAALVRACDFGPHTNRFGTAKLAVSGDRLLAVGGAEVTGVPSTAVPGTILACDRDSVTIATISHDLRLERVTTLAGQPVDLAGAGLATGGRLDVMPERRRRALTEATWDAMLNETLWVRRLASVRGLDLPYRHSPDPARSWHEPIEVPAPAITAGETAAAVCAFLSRLVDGAPGHVGVETTHEAEKLVCGTVPLPVPAVEPGDLFTDYHAALAAELETVTGAGGYLRDVFLRHPSLHGLRHLDDGLPIVLGFTPGSCAPGTAVRIEISPQGGSRWSIAREALPEPEARSLVAAFATFQRGLHDTPLDRVPLVGRDRCVHQLVAEQAARTPHAPAVVGEQETLTYEQLQQRVDEIAAGLAAKGAGPGDLIAVHLRRTPDLVAALLAVLTTGAAYVPLDPVYPPERLAAMLADSRSRLLLVDAEPDPAVIDAAAEVVHLDRVTLQGHVVDRATAAGRAYVIYTSGSSGRPKGVQVGHRALTNFLTSMLREPGLSADDQMLAVTTICFDIAALELFGPLVAGGVVRLVPAGTARDGHALLEMLERARPTVLQATPVTWRMLIAAGWNGSPGLTALCGGEEMTAELAEALLVRAGAVWNMYGPTETTVWSAVSRVRPGTRVTLGTPVAHTRLYVLDRHLEPVPDGVPGELCIGGDGVADGYLDRPELTADRFRPDPYHPGGRLYRTGDLVRRNVFGELEFLGRHDHQVRVRGYRIELGEIETRLVAETEVAQAVVMPCENRTRLAAYVTPEPGHTIDVSALRLALARTLPDHMIPATITVLDRLPQTANGKIDRTALPAPDISGAPQIKPRNALEERLCRLLGENPDHD